MIRCDHGCDLIEQTLLLGSPAVVRKHLRLYIGEGVAAHSVGKHDASAREHMDGFGSLCRVDGALLDTRRERIDLHDLQSVLEGAGFVLMQRIGVCSWCNLWGVGIGLCGRGLRG